MAVHRAIGQGQIIRVHTITPMHDRLISHFLPRVTKQRRPAVVEVRFISDNIPLPGTRVRSLQNIDETLFFIAQGAFGLELLRHVGEYRKYAHHAPTFIPLHQNRQPHVNHAPGLACQPQMEIVHAPGCQNRFSTAGDLAAPICAQEFVHGAPDDLVARISRHMQEIIAHCLHPPLMVGRAEHCRCGCVQKPDARLRVRQLPLGDHARGNVVHRSNKSCNVTAIIHNCPGAGIHMAHLTTWLQNAKLHIEVDPLARGPLPFGKHRTTVLRVHGRGPAGTLALLQRKAVNRLPL